MKLILWTLVQLFTGIVVTSNTKSQPTSLRHSAASNRATCPFRTINYITHALPQQCLATAYTFTDQNVQSALRNSTLSSHGTTQSASSREVKPTSIISHFSTPSPSLSSVEIDVPASSRSIVIPETSPIPPNPLEEDSALESGNFLSFEEWKRQNLKKTGQSEHVGRGGSVEFTEGRKRSVNVQNTLDSLGDDGEIDIDFTGFVPGGPEKGVHEATRPIAEIPDNERSDQYDSAKAKSKSKDAGTTYKERFNYASFDCAANILKTNREAKSSNAILLENKDSYMLNQCSAKEKFIILELCNDIEIDTIVLANFEFFSSTFRTFRVSVSDRYPVKAGKWTSLGVYEARNTRELQAFLVEDPGIWARYVRIDFLTHYGKEFYCPVSLLRVHGTTMMEDYKHYMVVGTDDDNEDDDSPQNEALTTGESSAIEKIPIPPGIPPEYAIETQDAPSTMPQDSPIDGEAQESRNDIQIVASVTDTTPPSIAAYEAISAVVNPSETCVPKDSPTPMRNPQDSVTSHDPVSESLAVKQARNTTTDKNTDTTSSTLTSTSSSISGAKQNVTENHPSKSMNQTKPNPTSIKSSKTESGTSSTTTGSVAKDRSTSPGSRSSGTSTQSPPAAPTIQESFFKSVQKRLQMLEANSSLSLQYIEDQSRALRDAFKRVEQRQLTKTTAFLDQLNSTVLNELREFRQQYDQLWQSTIIELEIQRERYERDNEAINARLGLLADEVIFQRRMGILQMVLILVCLVLVLFSRGSINNYLELPLVQNVLSRSPSSKWLNISNRSTPARPLKAGRAYGAYQSRNGIVKTHRRMHSEDSITDTQSGPDGYLPMTPVSFDAQSDAEFFKEEPKSPTSDFEPGDSGFDDPEFDPSTIERPSTSPPILVVNDASSPVLEIQHPSDEDAHPVQSLDQVSASTLGMLNGLTLEEPRTSELPIRSKHLTWNIPAT